MKLRSIVIRILFPILLASPALPAAQVTLTAIADTSLWQREPDKNLGASDLLPAGSTSSDGDTTKSRLLVRFDLTGSVPADAVVESASVYFHIVRAPSNAPTKPINGSTFSLRKALQPWVEGTKTYTDPQKPMNSMQFATAGETTWFYRYFGDENARWISPGGDLTDGDFAEAFSGEIFIGSGSGGDYVVNLSAEGLQDIRDWLANPGSNYGWMLKSESEQTTGTARIFASREYQTASYRPQLTVQFSLPQPNPPHIDSIVKGGNDITVRFSAQSNIIYRPQYRPKVESGIWTDLPDLGPLAVDGTLEFKDDTTGVAERFYRVSIP
jgi:hypothetical protein